MSDGAIIQALLIYVAVNIVLSFLIARMAKKKGRSFAGFFWLSFAVSAIIGVIVALIISPTSEAKMQVTTEGGRSIGPVACPYCKESIRPDATVCKHCGKDVEPSVNKILERDAQQSELREAQVHELAELRRQRRREQLASLKIWLRKRSTIAGAVIGASILLVTATAFGVSKVLQEAASNAKAKPLLEELNQWSTVVDSCGETPAGILDVNLASDQTLAFTVLDIDTTSPAAFAFIDCLGSGLGYVDQDPTNGTAVIAPLNTPLGRQIANKILILRGGYSTVIADTGYSVEFSDNCSTVNSCVGAVDVVITKDETFGRR